MGRKKRSGLKYLLLLPLLFSAACSHQTLSLFFDLPPPGEEEKKSALEQKKEPAKPAQGKAAVTSAQQETQPPAIEKVLAWEEADKLLPKDPLTGQPDWMAALRQGDIKPRAAFDGPGDPDGAVFGFDFFFPGPSPMFDAYFPHSSHTQWLGCDSCHPRIFRTRGTQMTMAEIQAGKYCGECHGVVAFGAESCARCHPALGGQ
jgi:c(7)-type cytochrome triheme protein